jgi:WD40 repeat protein
MLVTGLFDNTVLVWNIATGKPEMRFHCHSTTSETVPFVSSLAFSPDGRKLVSGYHYGNVRIWDTANTTAKHGFEDSGDLVRKTAFSPDGGRLVTLSAKRAVWLWNLATRLGEKILERPKAYPLGLIAFSPDGSKLLWEADKTVQIWNFADRKIEQEIFCTEPFEFWGYGSIFSPDSSKLASGHSDRIVRIWSIATGKNELEFQHNSLAKSLAFSPDGSRLAVTCHYDVRLWNTTTGQTEHIFEGRFWSIAFSPDGNRLATGSHHGDLKVWNVVNGLAERTLRHWVGLIRNVSFSPDGHKLVCGSDTRCMKVWDIATGQLELELQGEPELVPSVALGSGETERHPFYTMSGSWITRNDSRIIFLPVDYRARVFATHRNLLAFGATTDRIMVIGFRSDVEALIA